MLIVISPAKTLDYSDQNKIDSYTQPDFQDESKVLVQILKKKSPKQLQKLMDISEYLAELNHQRYQDYKDTFEPETSKQALLAFKGDVYTGFDLDAFSPEDFNYAQEHLRILSGLYGLLKPLDLIQPYRLEMGTSLKNKRGKNLYDFWGKRVSKAINEQLAHTKDEYLINLASKEYFSVLQPKEIKAKIISPAFKDKKNGQYKIISFFAKKARGAMSDFIIRHQIKSLDALKSFEWDGYLYNDDLSKDSIPVFTRDQE